MIQANELRLGNLFTHEGYDAMIFEVTAIDSTTVRLVQLDGYQLTRSMPERLTPIPLTDEWMIRLGFVEGRNHGGWVLLKDKSLGDYLDENVLYVFHHLNIPSSHIRNVHQLQNLYFALKGEELQVKQPV